MSADSPPQLCSRCHSRPAVLACAECPGQLLCETCDTDWHTQTEELRQHRRSIHLAGAAFVSWTCRHCLFSENQHVLTNSDSQYLVCLVCETESAEFFRVDGIVCSDRVADQIRQDSGRMAELTDQLGQLKLRIEAKEADLQESAVRSSAKLHNLQVLLKKSEEERRELQAQLQEREQRIQELQPRLEEEAERLGNEREEAERLRREGEEAEPLRIERDEAERLRQEREEGERLRQEREEGERLRQERESEEAERRQSLRNASAAEERTRCERVEKNGCGPMTLVSQQQSQTNYSRQHEANGQSVNQDVHQPQYAQQQPTQSSRLSSVPKTSYEQSRDHKYEPSSGSATDHQLLQAIGGEPQVQHRLRQETFQQIRNMNAPDTEKELLLRLVQDPKFCRFRLDDLVKAVQSGGDLAYEDEFMLAYLCSKCQKCEKPEPRHYQVCMVQCSCQLCFDCFRKFVFECINPANNISPSRFSCPGCQQPKPDDVEHFATHINFLSLQLEQIGETCSWATEAVIAEFERASDEYYHELSIKISKFSDTLSSTQPAYERLNAKGFYCPKCQCFFMSSKSVANHFTCYSCRHSFCPCCSAASSVIMSSHDKQCFFKSKNVSISVLKFILKESKIPFDKTARRRRNKSSSERGGRKAVVDDEWRCKAIDFKQGTSCSGAYLQCESRVYKKVCVCERHYKEYLLDLINENKIDMEDVCPSSSSYINFLVRSSRFVKTWFKSFVVEE